MSGVASERILVRCPNWLGDVVMTTPALRALRRARPAAKIVALLPPALLPLLEGGDACDELWPLASRAGGLAGWRADAARIAGGHFDVGLVIPESVSSALLMRLGRVRSTLGFARDPLRRALLHRVLDPPSDWGRRRMVSRERFAARLVAALGDPATAFDADDLRTSLVVTAQEQARLATALSAAGQSLEAFEADRPVVIAPGASFGDAKCWPADRFAALADRLTSRGLPVLLLGGPGESDRIARVRGALAAPGRVGVLDGVLDVGALKALLQGTRALVANDAGARHVAAAFAVPSLIFFGPTSVAKTPDNMTSIRVLESDHACRPCYRRDCPIDHRCLTTITVDRAEAALARLLDEFAGAGAGAGVGGGCGENAVRG